MSSRLRQARLERGWSEEEAAALVRALCRNGDQCGMNPNRLRDLELGRRHPGAAHADALSRLYGRDPAELGLRVYPDPAGATAPETPDATIDETTDETKE